MAAIENGMRGREQSRDAAIGRCKPCKLAFIWKQGAPKLRDALCPRCNAPLSQTTHLLRGGVQWLYETPKDGALVTAAKKKQCTYRHNPAAVGMCDGEITHQLPAYYANGESAYLCQGHTGRWNSMHPLGPIAVEIRKKR